ncbi:MAG: LLM class flavin-dependent oxidoreductase [Rhodospirillaceae bacterium]
MVGSAPGVVKWSLECVREGVERSGRDDAEVKRILVQTACLDLDKARARDLLRPNVAGMGYSGRAEWLFALAGISPPTQPEGFQEPYPDLIHALDWDHAMEITRYVPDETVDAMMLLGAPDEVVDRDRELDALGIDAIWWRDTFSWTRPDELLEALAADALPRLK